MRSMTAFAEIFHPLERGQLRLTLRSVNHKGLELNIRMHPAFYPLESQMRNSVRAEASRGKLDLALEVLDEPDLEPQLNRTLLRSVAKTWQEDAEWLQLPALSAEAFFRLPGAWLPPASDLAERLEKSVLSGLNNLLSAWNKARVKEAERLQPFFRDSLVTFRTLTDKLLEEAKCQAQELPELYHQKLAQILKDAQLQGQMPEERILAEAAALTERQDVREELVRINAHLDDFSDKLEKGQLGGKALDVWCQELLREFNTCGSKCKRISMTRLVMEAKGALDQVREQGMNLE